MRPNRRPSSRPLAGCGRGRCPRSGLCLGVITGSAAAQINLDAPKAYAVGGVGCGIDALEHPPAAPLSFQDNGLALFAELHQVKMVASSHRGWGDQGLSKPALVECPLRLQFFHIK